MKLKNKVKTLEKQADLISDLYSVIENDAHNSFVGKEVILNDDSEQVIGKIYEIELCDETLYFHVGYPGGGEVCNLLIDEFIFVEDDNE